MIFFSPPKPADADSADTRKGWPERLVRRPAVFVAAGALVVASAGAAFAASAHKTIEIEVDGEAQSVSTFRSTVGEVLDQAGVSVGEQDEVYPAVEVPLADGAEIIVRYAVPLTVTIDDEVQTVWTTAETASDALETLAAAGRDASAVASRSLVEGRENLDLPVADEGTVNVVVDGRTIPVTVDEPTLVSGVLELAEISLGEYDRVTLSQADDGTPTLTVARVAWGERVEKSAVAFGTREQKDDSLYEGQRRVVQAGKAGEIQRTYATVTIDGVEVYAAAPVESVASEPVEQVVAVGTKQRPVETPSRSATRSAPSSAPASSGGGAPAGGVWAALAQCESGGNPSIVSRNGLYHGLYQFSVSTWRSVGGSGLPSQASPAEQTARAQALQARSGWGQWPACSSKLGLR